MRCCRAGARVTAGGNKALSAAVASQSANALDALRLLLNFGADVHAVDNFALRWACLHNRCACVRMCCHQGDLDEARKSCVSVKMP
eukprot:353872-Chlamydomonas_euryale.AAC.14